MKETIELTAQTRKPGKGFSKAYRVDRNIPAVAYGPNLKENLNITITQNDAVKYATSKSFENTVFKLNSEDSQVNGLRVIVKEVSKSKTTHLPIHIDFYAPDMNKPIKINIELKFNGKPEGVKDGGLFSIIRREIEIECLPTDIPEYFDVNVESLTLNQALHVSDLQIESKYKVITDGKITLANVTMVEEEAAMTTSAEGEATAEATADKK